MSKGLTYWWKKYQVLRDLKNEYKSFVKEHGNSEKLEQIFFEKFFNAIN